MDARLDYLSSPLAPKVVKHVNAAGVVLRDSALPAATQELVKLRASQINGCGFCTDMHTKDALHAGESQQRLNLVAVWREATVFTEAERAAPELAEQGTRIADGSGGVTDEAWANAARHYDDVETPDRGPDAIRLSGKIGLKKLLRLPGHARNYASP